MLFKLLKDKPFDVPRVPESYQIHSERAESVEGVTIVDHLYFDETEGVKEEVVAISRMYDSQKKSERLICSPGFGQLPFIHSLYDYHASLLLDSSVSEVKSIVKGNNVETLISN